jgi:prefoldin alpha subunit
MEKDVQGNRMEKEKKLRQIMTEVEVHRRQIEDLSRQMQYAEGRIIELNSALVSLDAIKGAEKGRKILVPIGADAFIHAELSGAEKVIFGIGADMSIEDSVEGAEKRLKEKAEDMAVGMKKLQDAISHVNTRLLELDAASQSMMQDMQA